MTASENQIVVYQPNETVRLDVRLENETVWLTQLKIVELKEKVDFFVRTKEPPLQSIFYPNKFWDAKSLLIKFIRRATSERREYGKGKKVASVKDEKGEGGYES